MWFIVRMLESYLQRVFDSCKKVVSDTFFVPWDPRGRIGAVPEWHLPRLTFTDW